MSINFGVDSGALAHSSLPGTSVGLTWHNVQRQRLRKFARQYMNEAPRAVAVLTSQGQTDTANPAVVASRQSFTELRVFLLVLSQYYQYSGMHGGSYDDAVLAKIKTNILAWVRTNTPTGKPIDETNFEGLLKVIRQYYDDFDSGEQADIDAWLQALRSAKEAWSFTPLPGEGLIKHGNHLTHHYKIMLLLYDILDDTAAYDSTVTALQAFALNNFPFGNIALAYPESYTIVGTSSAEQRFDIDGDYTSRLLAGGQFTVSGNSQGNDGSYTISSSQYLTSSDKTRLFTVESVAADGGNGTLTEGFNSDVHDAPRMATDVGESIDYIRRDALHYHMYNLEPWLEIALETGQFTLLMDQAMAFLSQRILTQNAQYEFDNSVDPFDAARWAAARSEYLQPNAMFLPDKIARTIFTYQFLKDDDAAVDNRLAAAALRSGRLHTAWPYYFRWVFGGLYG